VSVVNFIRQEAISKAPAEGVAAGVFDAAVKSEEAKVKRLMDAVDPAQNHHAEVNPYIIGKELGDEMTAACTVVRSEPRLKQCLVKLAELKDRYSRLKMADSATWTNQSLSYTRAVGDMLSIADAVAIGALERRESRGAHYRSDHTERDDVNFMKSSVAKFRASDRGCAMSFVPIDASLVTPTARTYGKKEVSADKKPAAGPASVAMAASS
jgi:succinate dehydrogenase / fumarate reductase flavoprotein subunit